MDEKWKIWKTELLFGKSEGMSAYERDLLLAELRNIISNGGDVGRAKMIQERLKNDFSNK